MTYILYTTAFGDLSCCSSLYYSFIPLYHLLFFIYYECNNEIILQRHILNVTELFSLTGQSNSVLYQDGYANQWGTKVEDRHHFTQGEFKLTGTIYH